MISIRPLYPVILFLSLCLAGCTPTAPSADPPKKEIPPIEQTVKKHKPTIVGIITSVGPYGIRVEENPHEFFGGNKGVLGFGKATEYWIRDGKTYKRGKKEDLYPGMKVEVWVEGLIMESYPFQAGAKYIVYDAKELVDDRQKVYKEINNTKPDLTGKIAKIEKDRYLVQVHEGDLASPLHQKLHPKEDPAIPHWIYLKKESQIYHRVKKELRPGRKEDLKIGMEVKIWTSAIRESHPAQVDVKYLVY